MSSASPPQAAPRRRRGRDLLTLAGVQLLAGPLVGLAWWALTAEPSPWLAGEPFLTVGSLDAAQDGTLAVLGAVMGAAAGLRVLRRPGPRPLLTLAVGVVAAAAGSLLAVAVAQLLPVGIDGTPVAPRAWGVVLVWPILLLAVVFVQTFAAALGEWVREG